MRGIVTATRCSAARGSPAPSPSCERCPWTSFPRRRCRPSTCKRRSLRACQATLPEDRFSSRAARFPTSSRSRSGRTSGPTRPPPVVRCSPTARLGGTMLSGSATSRAACPRPCPPTRRPAAARSMTTSTRSTRPMTSAALVRRCTPIPGYAPRSLPQTGASRPRSAMLCGPRTAASSGSCSLRTTRTGTRPNATTLGCSTAAPPQPFPDVGRSV